MMQKEHHPYPAAKIQYLSRNAKRKGNKMRNEKWEIKKDVRVKEITHTSLLLVC